MVYLNNSEISDLAKKVIQKYKEYIGVEWELFKVEPIRLAEMLGLDVIFVDFGDDSEILGFTAFNDMSITLTDANQSDIAHLRSSQYRIPFRRSFSCILTRQKAKSHKALSSTSKRVNYPLG